MLSIGRYTLVVRRAAQVRGIVIRAAGLRRRPGSHWRGFTQEQVAQHPHRVGHLEPVVAVRISRVKASGSLLPQEQLAKGPDRVG